MWATLRVNHKWIQVSLGNVCPRNHIERLIEGKNYHISPLLDCVSISKTDLHIPSTGRKIQSCYSFLYIPIAGTNIHNKNCLRIPSCRKNNGIKLDLWWRTVLFDNPVLVIKYGLEQQVGEFGFKISETSLRHKSEHIVKLNFHGLTYDKSTDMNR